MKSLYLILIISLSIALFSCEKKINFNLKNSPSKLVVDATIENNQAPRVILSKSIGYFSQITPVLLAGSFAHAAEVIISDGMATDTLKEYSLNTGAGIYVYYYSTDSTVINPVIKGQLEHAYSLKIKYDNEVYLANTTIPKINKQIDSIWWVPAPANEDTTKVVLMIKATDPPGYGDYIRYFTKRNNEPFLAPYTSAYDDQFIDGTTYTLKVEPGVDRNAVRNKDGNYFYRGDTVTLKLSSIDKGTFDFWRTMEYSYQSIGNPFATPIKVISNVNNGALGYFGGYASQYRTIIIPH